MVVDDSNMMKCALCKHKNADKKGSHIIPFFIVESMHNIPGVKGRDYECSYSIDNTNAGIFIGRSILPDKIEKIFGYEKKQEELQRLVNPYIRDNIFCTECEKRLETIETFYSSRIHKVLKNKAILEKRNEILLKDNNYLRLFWLSVIWRCSITKFGTFQLKEKFEEQIRKILDKYLYVELIRLRQNLDGQCTDMTKLPLSVFFSPFNPKPTNNFLLLHPMHNKPYSSIINEYVILLYEKAGHVGAIRQSFFSLEKKYQLKDLPNTNESTFHVHVIPLSDWLDIIENLINFKAEDFINKLRNRFSYLFTKIFNKKPSQEVLNDFIIELMKGNHTEAERYSKSHITEIAEYCIKKHIINEKN